MTSDPLNQLILEITGRGFTVESRYNVAPTEQVPVLLIDAGQWTMRDMRWWLVPGWSNGPDNRYAMFNARSEGLSKSRAFRKPFESRRCIVPVTGYYEWRKEGNRKLPIYITAESGEGFAFAGLWDSWEGDGQRIESCTIITTAAPAPMQGIHSRMPVHLTRDEVSTWSSGETSRETLMSLLAPRLKFPLASVPVSTHVNNARNKDELCIEPLGPVETIH